VTEIERVLGTHYEEIDKFFAICGVASSQEKGTELRDEKFKILPVFGGEIRVDSALLELRKGGDLVGIEPHKQVNRLIGVPLGPLLVDLDPLVEPVDELLLVVGLSLVADAAAEHIETAIPAAGYKMMK
jgi:hypothetical protein